MFPHHLVFSFVFIRKQCLDKKRNTYSSISWFWPYLMCGLLAQRDQAFLNFIKISSRMVEKGSSWTLGGEGCSRVYSCLQKTHRWKLQKTGFPKFNFHRSPCFSCTCACKQTYIYLSLLSFHIFSPCLENGMCCRQGPYLAKGQTWG